MVNIKNDTTSSVSFTQKFYDEVTLSFSLFYVICILDEKPLASDISVRDREG